MYKILLVAVAIAAVTAFSHDAYVAQMDKYMELKELADQGKLTYELVAPEENMFMGYTDEEIKNYFLGAALPE